MSTSSTTTSTTTTTSTSTSTTTSSTSSSTTTTYPFYIVMASPQGVGIAQGVIIEAEFSQPLDTTTVNNGTFVVALKQYRTLNGETVVSNELVAGQIQIFGGNTIEFTPDSPLYEQADYDVVVDNDIQDTSGRFLTEINGWSFQTGIVDEPELDPSDPQVEPPLKDHYPRELDGLAVVSTYPAQYAAQIPLDLSPNNGLVTIQWNHPIASIGASNISWEALNGDSALADPRYNVDHSIVIDEELVNITITNGLVENSMVRITLQDVRDTEDRLDREYILFFAPVINPAYATIQVIRAYVGPFIDRVPDTTIAMLILEASLTAQAISNSVIVNPALYALALRKWVQCRVAYDLLFPTMVESVGKTKQLAEMMVAWQGISPREKVLMYDKFLSCIEKWEEILKTGGAGVCPIMTIKGQYDPDRPETGRGWTRRPSAPPYANTVVPKVIGRRGVKASRDPRGYYAKNRRGIYRRNITWD